jgi:hypothetical protein
MRSILLPVDKQVLINNISAYDHTERNAMMLKGSTGTAGINNI